MSYSDGDDHESAGTHRNGVGSNGILGGGAAGAGHARLLEDVWTLSSGEPTLTWRSFNKAKKVWEFQGLKVSRGSWDPGVAWSNGNERFVVQTFAGQTLARIRYQKVTANHFLWRADVSGDEGKTWLLDQWILEANRVK